MTGRNVSTTFKLFEERFKKAEEANDADAMEKLLNDTDNDTLANGLNELAKEQVDQLDPKAVQSVKFALLLIYGLHEMDKQWSRVKAARFRSLEARIKKLESRPVALSYGGIFDPRFTSKAGIFYTYSGSLWYCARDTTARPPGDDWQLAAKKGRDGKDAGQ